MSFSRHYLLSLFLPSLVLSLDIHVRIDAGRHITLQDPTRVRSKIRSSHCISMRDSTETLPTGANLLSASSNTVSSALFDIVVLGGGGVYININKLMLAECFKCAQALDHRRKLAT